MTTASLLLLAIALPQGSSVLPENDPIFVEVTSGRGTLLAGESTAELSPKNGEQWVEGRGHLSLRARAIAVLRWHGRASLKLFGPCEFEWEASSPHEALEWNFQSLTRAEVETRWSNIRIGLGESWSVWMPLGAMQISAVPGAGYEVLQEAGKAATYSWLGAQDRIRPTREGVIGRPVRLGFEPAPTRIDHSAKLAGRPCWTWPWREETQDVSIWAYRDWPWVAGPPRPVTVRVVHTPTAPPTQKRSPLTRKRSPWWASQTQTEPAEEPEVTPPPPSQPDPESPAEEEPSPQTPPYGDGTWGWELEESEASGPWRGLTEDGYMPLGDYFIQSQSGILYEELPDGGIRFWIPGQSQASGWVLGPRLDSRLEPGGAIEFGPTGALRAHSGGVRVLAALER